MTILAPLERWRIIAQTQQAYPSNGRKFTSFFNFISSTSLSMENPPKSKASCRCGEEITPHSGSTSTRRSSRWEFTTRLSKWQRMCNQSWAIPPLYINCYLVKIHKQLDFLPLVLIADHNHYYPPSGHIQDTKDHVLSQVGGRCTCG